MTVIRLFRFAATLRGFSVMLLIALGACDSLPQGRARDVGGQLVGWQIWHVIGADEARLRLAGDASSIRLREAASLPTRYQERWTIDNGHLQFEALNEGGFGAESTGPEFLAALYGDNPGLLDRGVRLEAVSALHDGPLQYASAVSPSHACVVFAVVFGERRFETSLGDRLLRGGLCARRRPSSVIALEAQMRNILARLEADGAPLLTGQEAAQP